MTILTKLLYCIIVSFIFSALPLMGRPYFVGENGNDGNSGLDAANPFKTIGKAAGMTNPGDTVFIMNGTYTPQCANCGDVVDITRSGVSQNWIVFKNYSGQSPMLKFDRLNGICISKGASYIEINGLTIRGNSANIKLADALNQPGGCNNPSGTVSGVYNGNGISIDGKTGGHCHHIAIKNTTIYECPGSGIGSQQADYITIDSCTVYNNCWYTAEGKSGIDLSQNWNIDNAPGYHCMVTNNKCFGNRLYVPSVSAQCKITDGNGIVVDGSCLTHGATVSTARTLIAFNIITGNGGSGIHINQSAHIDIINNTTYFNSQSDGIIRGEISFVKSNDVTAYNNIFRALNTKNVNTYTSDTGLRYDYNLHFGGMTAQIVGMHSTTADPLFVNPSTDIAQADFNLKIGSPGLAAGLDIAAVLSGYPWPEAIGVVPNMGAFVDEGGPVNQAVSIKSKSIALIAPSFKPSRYIGKNQIVFKTNQGYFNAKGEAVAEKMMAHGMLR